MKQTGGLYRDQGRRPLSQAPARGGRTFLG